ncbi:MAG: hypothetical protein NVS3B20_21170 [Polyangiales bacterium]
MQTTLAQTIQGENGQRANVSSITCTRYEAISGSRRCSHYRAIGACNIPEIAGCTELAKS